MFDQSIADTICARLANGESLRAIGKDENMPDPATVYRWLEQNEAFREQYTRARELQADTLFDEILEISDDGTNDWMERHNFDGAETGWHLNGEAQARSRLRIDARKWMAGKLRPKKYGEKLELDTKIGLSDPVMDLLSHVAKAGGKLVNDGES